MVAHLKQPITFIGGKVSMAMNTEEEPTEEITQAPEPEVDPDDELPRAARRAGR